MKEMSKKVFISMVLSEVRDCVKLGKGATAGDVVVTVPKLGLTERWIYQVHVNMTQKEIISKFVVRSNILGRTEYEPTNWCQSYHRWDSDLKAFLEREVGIV